MTISLSPELQAFVEEQVRSGKYSSADEAVADAVRRVKEYDEKLAWLRRELQVGIDQLDRGEVLPLDIDAMEAELRREIDLGLQDLEEGRVSDWNLAEMEEFVRRISERKKAV